MDQLNARWHVPVFFLLLVWVSGIIEARLVTMTDPNPNICFGRLG